MNLIYKMFSGRRVLFLSAALLLVASVSVSCKKKSSKLGKSVLTAEDLLKSGAVDTFRLYTYSEAYDVVSTANTGIGMVGAYHDPKMGVVSASLYTQLYATGTLQGLQPSEEVVVDSVVLAMEYSTAGAFYGKVQQTTFEVYRLDEAMEVNTTYSKTSTLAHQGGNLVVPGTGTLTPNPSRFQYLSNTDSLKPQLRLKLVNSLGETIIQDARTNTAVFGNNQTFASTYFKGLHLKTTDSNPAVGTGAVYMFNLNASQCKAVIYYRIVGKPELYTYELLVASPGTIDFNNVSVDNTGYEVADILQNGINNPMETYYAQAFTSYGVIELPSVKDLGKNAVIHAAYLSIPVAHHPLSSYTPAADLSVGYRAADGIVTRFNSTTTYNPGTGSYLVDVKSYVQAVVLGDGALSTKLYAYSTRMRSSVDRIIFNGPNTSNKYKPKLIIKYTKY